MNIVYATFHHESSPYKQINVGHFHFEEEPQGCIGVNCTDEEICTFSNLNFFDMSGHRLTVGVRFSTFMHPSVHLTRDDNTQRILVLDTSTYTYRLEHERKQYVATPILNRFLGELVGKALVSKRHKSFA